MTKPRTEPIVIQFIDLDENIQPDDVLVADFRRFLEQHRFLEEDLDHLHWEAKEHGRHIRLVDVERIFNACGVPDHASFSPDEVISTWPKYQAALRDPKTDWSKTGSRKERKPKKERPQPAAQHKFIIRQRGDR